MSVAKENVPELSSKEFSELLSNEDNKDKLIIVDFYAEWCTPCLMMAPIIEAMAGTAENSEIVFAKVNVEESSQLAADYKVSSIPCLVFLKNSREIDRLVGAVAEEQLQEKIKENS